MPFCLLSFLDVKFDHGGIWWPISTYIFRTQNKRSLEVISLEILLAHHGSLWTRGEVVRPLIKCFSSFLRDFMILGGSHGTHF